MDDLLGIYTVKNWDWQELPPFRAEGAEAGGDVDGDGDNQEVFDDVLAFHGGNKKSLPGETWEKHEWHEGGDKMKSEKNERDTFPTTNQENNTDENFYHTEDDKKGSGGNERESF